MKIVFPLLMPLAFSYITSKAFDMFKGKFQDEAGDKSKTMVNSISQKVIHKKIFKEPPTYLTIEQFNELIGQQTRELNSIVAEEISKYFEAKEVNSFLTGMTTSINNTIDKASTENDFNKLVSYSELKIQEFSTGYGPEWQQFCLEQVTLLRSLEPEKIKLALTDLKNNLEIIQNELLELRKELKQEHVETRGEIHKQTETFTNYFDKIEQYLQNIVSLQLEKNVSTNSLQTQYHSVFSSLIICPNCGKTTNETVVDDTWKCPDCNYVVTDISSSTKNRKITESTLIALSIYNQAITIKNSRGDIQFQARSYVQRVEVENAFNKFLEDNEENKTKKLFLLLGEPGVGKTWSAAALSNKYTHTIPVFYFQLRHRDTEEQLKSIFLDNPKLYDFNAVFTKIKEVLSENKAMKIFFVFDGFDELYEEIDQRWFFYQLLEPLSKIDRILICITSRKYDWNENSFRLKESQFVDEMSWKKEGINLSTYSDDEYGKIMTSLTSIAPLSKWEEHWNHELKRPFLHAIVKRLALELSEKPTFITINHPSLFELLEYRLQITKDDHPTIVKFAEAELEGRMLTRDDPEIQNSQSSVTKLLSAGVIKEQEIKGRGKRWFAPLVISDPFEEAYCHYVMFMSLRLRPKFFMSSWNIFITTENIQSKTKYWIEFTVKNTPELNEILSEPIELNDQPNNQPKQADIMENLDKKITKEIDVLIQIYKKRQVSIVRLSQRVETEYNVVLKEIEELLLQGKIIGRIDDNSTPEVSDDILDLAKNWNAEEELWIPIKNTVLEKYEVFINQLNATISEVGIGDNTETKIMNDFEKIKSLLDSLGSLKLSLNNIDPTSFITYIQDEITEFIGLNLNQINSMSEKIESITSQWEKNKENLDNQLLFELQSIETSIQKYEVDLSSFQDFILSNKDLGVLNVRVQQKMTKVLNSLKGISEHFDVYVQKLNRINGQLLPKVKEKKSFLENNIISDIKQLKEIQNVGNTLLTSFNTLENYQSTQVVSYEGRSINLFELEVIKDLNEHIGISLEPIYAIKWNSIGFVLNENNKIIELSLCNLNLESLPDSVSNLRYLKVLNIRKNAFTEIPEVLTSVFQLEKLFIEQNHVKDISNLYLLTNLSELHLYQNEIEKIPESISQLRNLKYLNFNSNKIDEIPESVKLLNNLQVLDLHKNHLKIVPDSLIELPNLKRLYIDDNSLADNQVTNLSRLQNNGCLIKY